jgi:aspartate kinase
VRLVVQKFGGTSVANAERIMAAARRAIRAKQAGNAVIVVVSARGDTTDDLIELAREITDQPPAREMDMLLATGEQISIALMAMAIQTLGQSAVSFTGAQVGIVTDSTHTKARIKSITTARMRQALDQGQIVIVAGFQGIDENYNITTLGRGGSDTTAVALAAVMKHSVNSELGARSAELPESCALRAPSSELGEVDCEIYTDVDGVYTTDPRIVPEARKMEYISYDEMLELASLGAGVMHSRSIEFAKKFDVPVQVRTSFSDAEGTWIIPEAEWMCDVVVCGAALVKEEARIAVDGVPDVPGISHRIFSALADSNIVVDMIAQSAGGEGRAAIGFTVPVGEVQHAIRVLSPLAQQMGARLEHDAQVSKVSVVGTGMKTHTGVAERMFAALAAESINMKMITTADIKISVLVDKADGVRALRAVHQAFNLAAPRPGAGLPPGGAGQAQFQRRPTPAAAPAARTLAALTQQLGAMEDIVVSDVVLDGGPGRHRRGHDRAEPDCRPGRDQLQRAAGRPGPGPAAHARGDPQHRPADAGSGREQHRQAVGLRRRHAHAHRRRPQDVRRPGRARHQHHPHQHQRGLRQRRRGPRPRPRGPGRSEEGLRRGVSGYFSQPRCFFRKANVPWLWISWPPAKNSISVRSGSFSREYSRRTFAYS